MSAQDGIVFNPWPHESLPGWSLPALEASKCVALQGAAVFERTHLRFYRAFFTEGRNIADRYEIDAIVAETDIDLDRFRNDYAAGAGRQAVIDDYRGAVEQYGVQSIPTVIVPATGRALVGLADLKQYRAAVDEAAAAAR